MNRRAVVALIVACIALRARAASSAADDEVIPLTVEVPYGFLFMHVPSLSAKIPPLQGWEYGVVSTSTNNFIFSNNVGDALALRTSRAPMTKADFDAIVAANPGQDAYYFDAEVSRVYAQFGTTVAPSVFVGASVSAVRVSGGAEVDRLIEEFHSTFGLGMMSRDVVPRGESTTAIRLDGHEEFLSPNSRSGIDDPIVFVKWAPESEFGAWRVAASLGVKLPIGTTSKYLSTGSADFGTAFALTGDLGRWCVNLNLGAVFPGNIKVLGGLDASPMVGASASFGYRLRTTSLWIELQWEQSPLRRATSSDLSDAVTDAAIGFRFPVGGRVRGYLALTENILEYENSADIGFHVGITWSSRAK